MKTRFHFWGVLLACVGICSLGRAAEFEVCGLRTEAAYKAFSLGEVIALRPTGSNRAYWGNLPGFAVVKKISVREARKGMMVSRTDTKTCHLVDEVSGPLVWTKGASNPRRDRTPVSGDLYLVTHAFFYPSDAWDAQLPNLGVGLPR